MLGLFIFEICFIGIDIFLLNLECLFKEILFLCMIVNKWLKFGGKDKNIDVISCICYID